MAQRYRVNICFRPQCPGISSSIVAGGGTRQAACSKLSDCLELRAKSCEQGRKAFWMAQDTCWLGNGDAPMKKGAYSKEMY